MRHIENWKLVVNIQLASITGTKLEKKNFFFFWLMMVLEWRGGGRWFLGSTARQKHYFRTRSADSDPAAPSQCCVSAPQALPQWDQPGDPMEDVKRMR